MVLSCILSKVCSFWIQHLNNLIEVENGSRLMDYEFRGSGRRKVFLLFLVGAIQSRVVSGDRGL